MWNNQANSLAPARHRRATPIGAIHNVAEGHAMPNPTALILLDEPTKLDSPGIRKFLASRHPGLPLVAPDLEKNGSAGAVFNFAGSLISVMQFDARLPDGWQATAQRSAIYWPEAEAVFTRHRGHVALNVIGESRDRLQVARVLTAVIGAIIAADPQCSGVLWDLTVANSSREFAELSRAAFAPYPDFPSALWVAMHPFRDPGSSQVGVVTNGLRQFIGREVELEGPSAQFKPLLITTRGLVTYLLQPGVTIRDGDTIGHSASERIEVQLVDSRRFQGLPVLTVRRPGM